MWGLTFATCVVGIFGIVNLVAFVRLLRRRPGDAAAGRDSRLGESGFDLHDLLPPHRHRRPTDAHVSGRAALRPRIRHGRYDRPDDRGRDHGGEHLTLLALSLPLLFAAGMAACDTGDSVMMARLYRWAAGDGGRFRRYNLIVTGLSVLIAGVVVIAGIAEVGAETATFALPTLNTEYLGFVATGVFALIAVVALVVARRRAVG